MTDRRRGFFTIKRRVLHDLPTATAIMNGIVIWHTEARFDRDEITYFAEHPSFDAVPQFERAPEYEFVVTGGVATWSKKPE